MKTDIDKKYRNICGVYKIENLITHKVYIGSSISLYDRYLEHRMKLRINKHDSFMLQRSFNKRGEENFCFSVLEKCDSLVRFDREQYWMDYFNSYDFKYGYNIASNSRYFTQPEEVLDTYRKPILCYGLDGVFIREYISIVDARRSLGITGVSVNLNNGCKKAVNFIFKLKESDTYPLNIDPYVRTIVFSNPKERNKNLSKALTGHKRTEKEKEKNRQWHLGLKMSEETKQKMSDSAKGKSKQPQQIQHFLDMTDKAKKKVNQIDLKTGEILNTFDSMRDASNFLGGDKNRAPSICGACQGKIKSAYNYKWQYA